MGHFKRGRSKNRRSGCLFCKPQKLCGQKAKVRDKIPEQVSQISFREQLAEGLGYDREWFWDELSDEEWLYETCDCSECCSWQENLEASPAHLSGPLVAPVVQPHQTYRASRNRGNTSGISR